MRRTFGEDGFALYQLPQGQQISPEQFSEFGSAYRSLTETTKFSEDIRQAIVDAAKPVLFVEGALDIRYIQKAAEILDQQQMLADFQVRDGGGYGGLNNIWKHYDQRLSEVTPQKIILLYDCDEPRCDSKGILCRQEIPRQDNHPLKKGIENLFGQKTLNRARCNNRAFIDITPEITKTERGVDITIPEEWAINPDEKTNLCNWLCDNGTVDDFQHFQCVFDLLEELLDLAEPSRAEQSKDKRTQQTSQ